MQSGIKESRTYVHPHWEAPKGQILMVMSSPTVSKQTGWPIGFWASELTHPYLTFRKAGYAVDFASTKGGEVVMDGYSDPDHESGYSSGDVITKGYLSQSDFKEKLNDTKLLSEIDAEEYDAIFLVGGQGPMYTFRNNAQLESLFTDFYESGKPAAAVCHATSLLLNAKDSKGKRIVEGKSWTGFSNQEEDISDNAVGQKIQPYRIEDEASKIPNTNFKVAPPLTSYAIADGNLITGQQQNSGEATARLVIEQLSNRSQLS